MPFLPLLKEIWRVPPFILATLLWSLPLRAFAEPAPITDPIGRAQALLAALGPTTATADYAQTARDFGTVIDSVRQTAVDRDALLKLIRIATQLKRLTSERLQHAETEAGDSEAALESVYRSPAWDDLSFALAAFPYWRGWLELTLAERAKDPAQKSKWLLRSKRGFRAASMQLFQPSIVYGGWLGLGYAALAEGKREQGRSIFQKLDQALATDPGHPIHAVVATELRRLSARQEEVAVSDDTAGGNGAIGVNDVGALRAEALGLLEQYRKTRVGNREAGELLRRIIDAGQVDLGMLSDILRYKAEIASQDLRIYTDLVGAEYALENDHFYDAAMKYKKFFAAVPRGSPLNFDRFRYRYALACLKSDLTEPAAQIAEELLRNPGLEPEVKQAAIKLAYVARAMREASKSSTESKQALDQAAKRFIAANPKDPDADAARLVVAQNSAESGQALQVLNTVQNASRLHGSVERTRFFVASREFAKAIRKGPSQGDAYASQGLQAWDTLPADDKKDPENHAVYLQMRAAVDSRPAEVVQAITLAEQQKGMSLLALRALFWAKLKCFDRMGTPGAVADEIKRLALTKIEGWRMELLYPWIVNTVDLNARLELVSAIQPLLAEQPDMDRRVRLMHIDILSQQHKQEEAYAEAKALIEKYPKAGDGWRALGKTAASTNRLIEADRAWRVITDKAPSNEVWLEGMFARIDIRTASLRAQAACELLAELEAKKTLIPADQAARIPALGIKANCVAAGSR